MNEALRVLAEKSSALALLEHRERAEQIVGVVVRYGLADAATLQAHPLLADLAGRTRPDPRLIAMTRAERLRDALVELGTTFIKIGQLLSTRADLVGPATAATLSTLQADDPADAPDQVRATISATLGVDPDHAFATFDVEPLASASIGQVCRATTADGRDVVVKVRHAGVAQTVEQDLAILTALARLLEREVPATRQFGPERIAGELARSLRDELDFRRESVNLARIRNNFAEVVGYAFPEAIEELSGDAVLTETRLDGVRLSEVLTTLGTHADDVVHRIADIYFRMIFVDGLFHADPHPGNLLLLPDGRLGVLDFGKCGRLRDGLREAFVDFLAAVFGDDIEEATRCMLVVAPGPATLDAERLSADLEAWVERYFNVPSGSRVRTDLGAAVTGLLDLVHRYGLRMPADIVLMLIVVAQLQGLLEESGSTLTLTEILMPYAATLRRERLSPQRMLRSATRAAHRWERLLDVLPGDLTRLLETGSRGELRVPLRVDGLDRPVNRLAYALIAAATINGATALLSRRTEPTVGRVSLPGLVGTAASVYLAGDVVRAVRRSGGL